MSLEKIQFPEKIKDYLFWPYRYKSFRGGRGSTKSWSVARALLAMGAEKGIRVLCAREVQRSIKDSVHRLLSDQIGLMGLDDQYTIFENSIRHNTTSAEFAFTGLASHTVHTLKSFEGCDICWVEEAQVVCKRSWDILIPTIRKDDSEIWLTWNPDLETDETYRRFVTNPPPDCLSIEINWRDNPWWNPVMEAERLHAKETDPHSYDNIWEGKCRPAVEGAIFHDEIKKAIEAGRVCNVPYDPMLKVHIISDLGNLDAMFCAFVQKLASEIRIIRAVQGGYRSLPEYSTAFKAFGYNWGKWWLPHDGFSVSRQSGKSDADILRALGWIVPKREEIVEKSVEAGIREARMIAHQCYFDKTLADPLLESMKRYRRRINQQTDAEASPLADHFAHGGDCFRYIALNAPNLKNEDDRQRVIPQPPIMHMLDPIIGY